MARGTHKTLEVSPLPKAKGRASDGENRSHAASAGPLFGERRPTSPCLHVCARNSGRFPKLQSSQAKAG